MRKMLLVGALVVPAALLSSMQWATSAPSATFKSPASAPAGSLISLSSITPCRSPVAGRPIVRVSVVRAFHQPGRVLATATFQTSVSGNWSGTLRVPAFTPGGGEEAGVLAQLTAACFASPQAEGALLTYTARDFTITPPVRAPAVRAPAAAPVTGPARFTG